MGVITWVPDLVRSAQVWMLLGLPLRTAMTATEAVTMPPCTPAFQSVATMPSLTRRAMSGSSEKATTSAANPASTARLWSPEAPKDSVKVMSLPCAVAWKALMIWS